MAKILNSTTVSGNISKMVEMPDKLIVNGQTYDKNTFSPVPFDFCPLIVSGNNEMNMLQTAYVNSYWFRNSTTNGYMLDNNDPSTCYVVTQGIYGGTGNAAIHKLSKNSSGVWTDNQGNTSWGPSYAPVLDLISQDSQKLYYTTQRTYSDYSFIAQVNKTTMTDSHVQISKGILKVLKDTDMYIYFSATTVNGLTYNVGKYDKVNNAVTWLLADGLPSGYYFDILASDMQTNGVFYAARDGLGMGMTDHYVAYRKYVLNTTKDTVVTSNVTVDMSLLPAGKIQLLSGSGMAITQSLINFTDPNTGTKYINHLIYNKGAQSVALNPADSALYTYQIIDDDHWKLVSYTNFNPVIYKTFLPVINNQTLILAYENGCQIYTWDTGTTSYKKVSSFDAPVLAVGTDSNNNLYVQYTDSSIEMVSNVMPTTVFGDFENDVYDYKGSDLSANVIVYVKNYQGKYISTSVQLTLYGNCKFTDDGKRTKTVTTSNLDVLTIPVTITDSGNLKVAVKIL